MHKAEPRVQWEYIAIFCTQQTCPCQPCSCVSCSAPLPVVAEESSADTLPSHEIGLEGRQGLHRYAFGFPSGFYRLRTYSRISANLIYPFKLADDHDVQTARFILQRAADYQGRLQQLSQTLKDEGFDEYTDLEAEWTAMRIALVSSLSSACGEVGD